MRSGKLWLVRGACEAGRHAVPEEEPGERTLDFRAFRRRQLVLAIVAVLVIAGLAALSVPSGDSIAESQAAHPQP